MSESDKAEVGELRIAEPYQPRIFHIYRTPGGDPAITFHPDGRIVLGKGVTPEEAAEVMLTIVRPRYASMTLEASKVATGNEDNEGSCTILFAMSTGRSPCENLGSGSH